MNDFIRRQEEIFSAALELPVHARSELVRLRCGVDMDLAACVLDLLAAAESAGPFLETSAATDVDPKIGSGRSTVIDGAVTPRNRIIKLGEAGAGDWIGNYRVIRKLGEGGCGVVFEAEQVRPIRRTVALKVIKLGMDTEEVVSRFEAERQALALMEHPNIARVFEAGATESGRPYFVMELIRGQQITQYCDERRLSHSQRLQLFQQVCRALQHAHDRGVIHRDIKPSNILVAECDDRPVPKVIDFGVAKATQAPLTDASLHTSLTQLIGTPTYMSPEQVQLRSADIDARTDVYGLGVLLYELMTGTPPHDPGALVAHGVDEMRRRICEVRPQLPSVRFAAMDSVTQTRRAQERGQSPAEVITLLRTIDGVIMRCLEKRREHRYPGANALAADVQRLERGEAVPVLLHPAPKGGGLRKEAGTRDGEVDTAVQSSRASRSDRDDKTLAVLPFSSRGSGPEGNELAAGIHEDVITHLAKIHDLRVIARTSVVGLDPDGGIDLRKIAGNLGVVHVMEGSVRVADGRLRISTRLTDTRTLRIIWAETFDHELKDIFALQSRIAREIAGVLSSRLTTLEGELIDRVPTANQSAYAAFLRGRALATRSYNWEDVSGAAAAFQDAISLDPQFALAWAHLSMAHGAMYWFTCMDPTPERLARCKAAIDRALRLDPRLPEAHFMLGVYYYRGFRDWGRAWVELEEAHENMPGDAEVLCACGLVLRRMGRWVESTRAFSGAVALDPRNGHAWLGLIDNRGFHHCFREALAACDRVLAFAPDHRHARHRACWCRFAIDGDREALLAGLDRCIGGAPNDARDRFEVALLRGDFEGALRILETAPVRSFRDQKREVAKSELQGLAAFLLGDFERARKFGCQAAQFYAQTALHREPEKVFTTLSLARALAFQGRKDDALTMGHRALQMLPVARDALWGPEVIGEYATICLLVGEVDQALAYLESMLRHPWDMSENELRFDPVWRRLATDARFASIATLASPV